MSTRLQVVLDDDELAELRRVAARHGMTVSAWVRQALRAARRAESDIAPSRKLELIRRAVEHEFPSGDIDVMLAETEQGYLSDPRLMIFLDANIPMYLIGAEHPNKTVARRLLESAVGRGDRLVTDVEVLQEILHRYVAIGRAEAIQPAFDVLLGLVDETFGLDREDLESAKQLILGALDLSARDALHVAVMHRYGVDTIMSFDRGFDRCPGLTRLG